MDKEFLDVAEAMVPTTVSVNVNTSVAAAADILRREALTGLPVCAKGRVVGLVTPLQLLKEPPYRPVGAVMTAEITPATPDLSLSQVYALMARQRVNVLPVVDAGAIVGQIAMVAVLRAKGQQSDPLTGLAWATAMRSWASAALADGREIAILFVDLDNFGEINKVLGHVAGDEILRSITHLLGSLTDPSTDLLCRYGGDEFAVATTRGEEGVRALAARIEDRVAVPVEMNGELGRLTVSVGVAGGRRVGRRWATHVPATVEDLIAAASRESTAVKKAKSTIAAAPAATAPVIEASVGHEAQLRAEETQVGGPVAPAPARSAARGWRRAALGAAAVAASFTLGVVEGAPVLHQLGVLIRGRERAVPHVALAPHVSAPAPSPAAPPPAPPPAPAVARPRLRAPGYAVSIGTFPTDPEATRVMHLVRSKGYVVYVVPRGPAFEVATSRLRFLIATGVADALEVLGYPAHRVALGTDGQIQ